MSLKDIAEIAGVSPSTVSRVLNDKPSSAGAEKRDEIWRISREMGYTPNTAARKLRMGEDEKERKLSVIVALARIRSLDEDPFFLELFREVETQLMKCRVSLSNVINADGATDGRIISAAPREGKSARQEGDINRCDTPDGVIILGRCSEELLKSLRAISPNLVGLWRNPMNFEVDEVVCDGQKAAAMAVEYLLSLGHKKIAYIGDCSYETRYVGYSETLIRHQLPINYRAIIHCEQTTKAGYEAMTRLLEFNEVTALLTANDAIAVGAIKAMREKRRRDISLISIDDIDTAQTTSPMLTTVRVPRRDMAHMAVTLLLDRISGGHSQNVRVELPCRVISRESCFPI